MGQGVWRSHFWSTNAFVVGAVHEHVYDGACKRSPKIRPTRWFQAVVATRLLLEVELSTCRIPKGPGRRPKSLARRRFVKLMEQGWTVRAVCREIGVCRQTGQTWKTGSTVVRKVGTVKHIPPLNPLSTRVISPRFRIRF